MERVPDDSYKNLKEDPGVVAREFLEAEPEKQIKELSQSAAEGFERTRSAVAEGKWAYFEPYDTPGTLEYEAHEVIEPEIRKRPKKSQRRLTAAIAGKY